jgi:hypothetical protein
MHVCALGNVIGRTCREYAAGAVHHVRIANFSYGSWSCENVEAGSLTGLDCSATKLCEVCAQYFSDFARNAT